MGCRLPKCSLLHALRTYIVYSVSFVWARSGHVLRVSEATHLARVINGDIASWLEGSILAIIARRICCAGRHANERTRLGQYLHRVANISSPEPRGKRGSQRPQPGILGASGIQPGFYPACRIDSGVGGVGIAPSSLNGSGHHEQAVHYTGPKGRGHVVYVCRSRRQYGSRHPRLKQDRPR